MVLKVSGYLPAMLIRGSTLPLRSIIRVQYGSDASAIIRLMHWTWSPKVSRDDLYKMLMHAWDADSYKEAKKRLDQISVHYQDKYPDLAEFISEHGWETLGVYDAAQVQHHKRLRTTNMIERVNQEH